MYISQRLSASSMREGMLGALVGPRGDESCPLVTSCCGFNYLDGLDLVPQHIVGCQVSITWVIALQTYLCMTQGFVSTIIRKRSL